MQIGKQLRKSTGCSKQSSNTETSQASAASGNNNTDITNTQEQNVNQDNDISNNVSGNDNYIVNNQDNSVRNYGGDNRSFVYNSNSEGPDTATMATLAGYYAPDDSPAAQAKRLDFISDEP